MKRAYLFISTLALIALVACTQNDIDDVVIKPNTGNSRQTITIHADLPVESRAIHGTEENATSFSWQAGEDQIGVRIDGDYYWDGLGYRFTNTTDGDKAVFVLDHPYEDIPALSVGSTFISYYPYGTAIFFDPYSDELIGRPILRNALGSLLQIGDNNTDHLYRGDYMFSRPIQLTDKHFDSDGNVNVSLEFGHIFSKMRFTVKNSTSQKVDLGSLIYRSTKEDDVMLGTLYLDASTGEFVFPEYSEYGDIPPSNSSVLEVQDVSLNPGETATLWMWVMPYDFTEGNPDGRKADIMINTQLGVFRVQNVNFNTRFVPGCVYRQGFELTEEKLLSDYAYISDPNFARILYTGNESNWYDEETGNFIGTSFTPIYDLNLQPYPQLSEDALYGENPVSFSSGCYIKASEAKLLEHMQIDITMVNALSLDGLQYFTGLKDLSIQLGSDMNAVMSLRALKLSTLTELEGLYIMQAKVFSVDVSHNTKLKDLAFGNIPTLETITGLDKLSQLKTFSLGSASDRFKADLSNNTSLKEVTIECTNPSINISNLNLDVLNINTQTTKNIVSNNLSCTSLWNHTGEIFPSGAPQGVKDLHLYIYDKVENNMFKQFQYMTEIENMELIIGAPYDSSEISFTEAQSSVKKLNVSQDSSENGSNPTSGWNYLTNVEELSIDSKWYFSDSHPLNFAQMTKLSTLSVKARGLKSISVPSSAKLINLNVYNNSSPSDIALTSSGVEDLEILTSGTINVGNCPMLKKSYLVAYNVNNESIGASIGVCPQLNHAIFNLTRGDVKYNGTNYTNLETLQISGKYIKSIPSATVIPNLTNLYIGYISNADVTSGIGALDLTGYSKLVDFSMANLNESGYPYYQYNNRYYTGSGIALRGKGAFTITEAQYATAKANAKLRVETDNYTLPDYSGITYDPGTPAYYEVNTVYKVVDGAGNEVSIADSDASDGECTILINSKNSY